MPQSEVLKTCARCKTDKPLDDFAADKRRPDGKGSYCLECNREKCRAGHTKHREKRIAAQRKFREENLEAVRERRRNWDKENPEKVREGTLKRNYGLTLEQYREMLHEQAGVCAICGQPETCTYKGKVRDLCVDHDHETGRVRQLLCAVCNLLIGKAGDDPVLLEKAAIYLRKHGGKHASK